MRYQAILTPPRVSRYQQQHGANRLSAYLGPGFYAHGQPS